jgi:hypothetical protein
VPASFRQLVDGFREYRPHMRGCVRKSPYRTRPIYPFSSRVTERVYSGKRSSSRRSKVTTRVFSKAASATNTVSYTGWFFCTARESASALRSAPSPAHKPLALLWRAARGEAANSLTTRARWLPSSTGKLRAWVKANSSRASSGPAEPVKTPRSAIRLMGAPRDRAASLMSL